jgi:hypothetical protein
MPRSIQRNLFHSFPTSIQICTKFRNFAWVWNKTGNLQRTYSHMGRICLAAHSHRDAWPTTYAGRRRIRPTNRAASMHCALARARSKAALHRRGEQLADGDCWQRGLSHHCSFFGELDRCEGKKLPVARSLAHALGWGSDDRRRWRRLLTGGGATR